MKSLTDAQARAYIQGEEPFDKIKWNEEHAERLACAAFNSYFVHFEECSYLANLKKTVEHYLNSEYMKHNEKAKNDLESLLLIIKKQISEKEKIK